jgi:hypothetical protein
LNSLLYFLAEYYPFWGIPATLILSEIANHSRRNSRTKAMFLALFGAAFFGSLSVLYFWQGGHDGVRAGLQEIEYKYFR